MAKTNKKDENLSNQDTYTGVISSIVSGVASQVEGIASVSYAVGVNGPSFTPSRKSRTNAIVVSLNNDSAIIDIAVNVYYGYVIPQVICVLQEKIKQAVEEATFYKIKSINVFVVGVVSNN